MVRKPLSLFVFIATAGNSLFKAVGQRHSDSLRELSQRSRVQGSAAQLLGDVAVVCVVPVTSIFRARILGQSVPESQSLTSFEIAKEVCLCLFLALLSAWFLKRVLAHGKQVVLPAAQPTKRACSAEHSPQKGLTTSSPWNLRTLLARPWQIGRRCVQRRRLYIHKAVTRLEGILPSLCASQSLLASRLPRASAPGSHGLHDWHEALPAGFLMPVEVAACRSPPEVRVSLMRLLADRWWELDAGLSPLESVPEDDYLLLNEPAPADLPDLLDVSC